MASSNSHEVLVFEVFVATCVLLVEALLYHAIIADGTCPQYLMDKVIDL